MDVDRRLDAEFLNALRDVRNHIAQAESLNEARTMVGDMIDIRERQFYIPKKEPDA